MTGKETIELIIQGLGLLGLYWYTWKTHQMQKAIQRSAEISERVLQEMQITREETSAPYVVVYFDVEVETHAMPSVYLIIKNEGKTVAKNVRLSFDPQLPTLKYIPKARDLNDLYFVREGIPTLSPGYTLKISFGMYAPFAEKGMTYKVSVSYYDWQTKPFCTESAEVA